MAKTRSELEAMSKSELLRYADEQHILIPARYGKPEIVDTILVREVGPVAEKLVAEIEENEKPDYVVEHEAITSQLEKAVAMAAVEHGRKKAAAKSAQRVFDNLLEQLTEHLASDPVPTLFDTAEVDERQCRICENKPSDDKHFVADDLCQVCADNLGKDESA